MNVLMALLGAVRNAWVLPLTPTELKPITWPDTLIPVAVLQQPPLSAPRSSVAALMAPLAAVRKAWVKLTPVTWPEWFMPKA